jgi:hypothetical protein
MIIRKGYKFRLRLRDDQGVKFRQFAGSCRFVWNKALAIQNDLFKNEDEYFKINCGPNMGEAFEAGYEIGKAENAEDAALGMVVKEYLAETGSWPGNNDYWWNKFQKAISSR